MIEEINNIQNIDILKQMSEEDKALYEKRLYKEQTYPHLTCIFGDLNRTNLIKQFYLDNFITKIEYFQLIRGTLPEKIDSFLKSISDESLRFEYETILLFGPSVHTDNHFWDHFCEYFKWSADDLDIFLNKAFFNADKQVL